VPQGDAEVMRFALQIAKAGGFVTNFGMVCPDIEIKSNHQTNQDSQTQNPAQMPLDSGYAEVYRHGPIVPNSTTRLDFGNLVY
jgi:hypothetical protein